MKKAHTGSCHCGAVRYEVDLDLSEGTVKCNCSICGKTRAWLMGIPPGALRLLAGENELSEYQFGNKAIHHLFCKRCGVRTFSRGDGPNPGGAIHIATLDDVDIDELVRAPVTYVNGRHDDFQSPPAETRHL